MSYFTCSCFTDRYCAPLRWLAVLVGSAFLSSTIAADEGSRSLGDVGEFPKWSKVELTFQGPTAQGTGNPNPFDIDLQVLFHSPSGRSLAVPGFFDGDGQGGLDGNVWKVRFAGDETGQWTFRSQSENDQLDSCTGAFTVKSASADATDFYRWGRLQSVGSAENGLRYLKFADGPFWLKAGCDDPENFLGNYKNYDTFEKRQAAIDYLAGRGINSLYIMSHNVDGDDKDVWPWLGETPQEAKSNSVGEVRFDTAKLDQWRELFEYMQQRGLVVYLVLEDDSAWKRYDHQRYYREMIARFGYLPALVFNLGEEHNENYQLSEAIDFMQQLADLDPYDHPRGIHNVNVPSDAYIDAAHIDFTSIQTGTPESPGDLEHALQHNRIALDWLRRCEQRQQRILMLGFDEGRPELQRQAWWSAYLAGGVWEAHVLPPYDRPMSAWQQAWNELGGARTFMESLPFWQMHPQNDRVKSGQAFCLAQDDRIYALYLPKGGAVSVDLPHDGSYSVEWWNPSNDLHGDFQDKTSIHGGVQTILPPGDGDWAVRILKLVK